MYKFKTSTLILLLFIMSVGIESGYSKKSDDQWIDLFDKETLSGWSVHSGYGKYHVEDGTIVGTAVKGSPNTFLCTDKEYCNFILEFEVKLEDPELNSGVQFRSKIANEEKTFWFRDNQGQNNKLVIPKDRVYGYQAEIATEKRGSSGGIYDEARRAFMLQDVSDDPKASKAFKDKQWNTYRIECIGSSIKTFINDIPCADLQDSMTQCGVIGLQVHDVGDDPTPYQVRWRNIRIKPMD
ncbi:DUF1080 domain-containing protein [candidate division KSB1 bacterium]|nr:DUF1080 domain-containing protein [candidate division KSB1 bacterium]